MCRFSKIKCLYRGVTYIGGDYIEVWLYIEAQNKGRSYIPNPFKHIPWDLRSQKDKNKDEVNSPSGDDFEEQLLIGYGSPSEGRSSIK